MQQTQIKAIVHRNSNGSVELLPEPSSGIERIVVHAIGTPSSKTFPVGGVVTLNVESEAPRAESTSAPSEVAAVTTTDAITDALAPSAPATERRAKASS